MGKLSTEFFNQDTTKVAKELLGKRLVVTSTNGTKACMITETEGYLGERDDACHSRSGKTLRTKTMYQKAGTLYVYLIYGIHHMLNIVTKGKDSPEAVLIRGVEGFDGPGKLTKNFGIIKSKHNGKMIGESAGIWIEDGEKISDSDVKKTPRIGIDYANNEWREKKLRFIIS